MSEDQQGPEQEEGVVESEPEEKVVELRVAPKKVKLNDLPQCVVAFSLTGLARLLQLPNGVALVDVRISDKRLDGEKLIQFKVAGVGRPPMAGKLPIVNLGLDFNPLFGTRLSWSSAQLLVDHDAKPLPVATWPSDGSEKLVQPDTEG